MTTGQGLYGLREPALPQKPPSRWRKWRRVFYFAAGFFIISLLTLHFIGGNDATLKMAVEKYLMDETGLRAEIGTLNAVEFYPVIGIDMDDVAFYRGADKVAHIGHFNFSTGFWGASSGNAIRTLDIRGISVDAGVITPLRIEGGSVVIRADNANGAPEFALSGRYGGHPVSLNVPLKTQTGFFGGASYGLGARAAFTFAAGPLAAHGFLTSANGGRRFDIDELKTTKDSLPVKATVALALSARGFALDGTVAVGASRRIGYDLSFKREKDKGTAVTGKINADSLALADITGRGGLLDSYAAAMEFYDPARTKTKPESLNLNGTTLDIALKIAHLVQGKIDLGSLEGRAVIRDGQFSMDPLAGRIVRGALTGAVHLDARKAPAEFSLSLNVKDADYTLLTPLVRTADQKDDGLADVKIMLNASGNTLAQLRAGLDGKAMIVAGPGELATPLIGLWGGGVLNAMLPTFRKDSDHLRLNCGIGDFAVENGQAKAKTFFIDTDRVTVTGTGGLNLDKGTISMEMNPKTKGTAFLSAATAIRISGPVGNPHIAPDALSLGKTLGGLVLGVINPAYLAFSMTDLGIGDKHPCRAYLKP